MTFSWNKYLVWRLWSSEDSPPGSLLYLLSTDSFIPTPLLIWGGVTGAAVWKVNQDIPLPFDTFQLLLRGPGVCRPDRIYNPSGALWVFPEVSSQLKDLQGEAPWRHPDQMSESHQLPPFNGERGAAVRLVLWTHPVPKAEPSYPPENTHFGLYPWSQGITQSSWP